MSDYNSWSYEDENSSFQQQPIRRSVQSSYSEDSNAPSSRFSFYERGEEYQRPEAQFAAIGRLNEQEENDAAHEKLVNSIIGYCHIFAEQILTHPFIVLRRQCQVSRRSNRYHLTPFTVLVLGLKIQSQQGPGSLWKGIGSSIMVKGISVLVEAIIEEIPDTPLSRTSTKDSIDDLIRKLSIKTIVIVIITPLICSSLLETVQSSIASETPSVFEFLREGGSRIARWSMNRSSRLLPIWVLYAPALFHGLLQYTVSSSTKSALTWFTKPSPNNENGLVEDVNISEVTCSLVGSLAADVICFPIETVFHRMCLQGTRTLIDNVDSPGAITPVISDHDGFFECYKSVIMEETKCGLFKGFGALVLQYLVHYAFLKLSRAVIDQLIPSPKDQRQQHVQQS